MTDKIMKCAIYLRVSTTDQNPENQLSQLKAYAEKQDWRIIEVVEDTVSGGKGLDERAGLKKIFEMARQGKFDVLLFWSLDRLSREGSRRTLEYLTVLDSYKVKWHSYTEPYISSLGIFADCIISLLSTLAKQERIRISERTIAGLKIVAGRGVKLGRPKTARAVIEKARELRKQGKSFTEIGREIGYTRERAYQLCKCA
jgi:DNA invertase Pin-like site-specific DNA recombinase